MSGINKVRFNECRELFTEANNQKFAAKKEMYRHLFLVETTLFGIVVSFSETNLNGVYTRWVFLFGVLMLLLCILGNVLILLSAVRTWHILLVDLEKYCKEVGGANTKPFHTGGLPSYYIFLEKLVVLLFVVSLVSMGVCVFLGAIRP